MRRDILCVRRDSSTDCIHEYDIRDRRDGYESRRVLHALRVAVGTEDGDAPVWMGGRRGVAEGFEAFIGLLTVVEGGGEAVERDVRGGHEGEG